MTLEIPAKSFTVVDEEGRSVHTGLGADIYIGFGQPDERTERAVREEERETSYIIFTGDPFYKGSFFLFHFLLPLF